MISPGDQVWITGVGAATPMGCDLAAIEANLLAGRSGISEIRRFPTTDFPCRIAGQIGSIPRPESIAAEDFAPLPPLDQVTLWSVETALRDAGRWADHGSLRIGLILGLGAEFMENWSDDFDRGGTRVYDPDQDRDTTLTRVAGRLGLRGPSLAISAACASGNHALEIARNWLRWDLVDLCVAGAFDMAVTPVGVASFGNLRALSRRNDVPTQASRPFDRDRDGFVPGEGGVAFVLERADAARSRSAPAYAEVLGCGSSSDAYHLVIPSPDPAPASRAIRAALRDARIEPEQVDHINAHATSTPVGDAAEAVVLRNVFGAAADRIPITSTKSMTGHLLTAAGAIEAIACVTALRHGAIPPTINLDNPDVELCLVRHEARPHRVAVAMSNSFGFGGSNTCLILRSV